MTKAMSFVKACKDFFEEGDGRPLTFEEFKSLSTEDKERLRQLLIEVGYDIRPVV